MGFLSFFGLGRSGLKQALRNGAAIIDVRTIHEFDQGHAREAIHIPLDRLPGNIERIKQLNRPVVFCCATGSRSAKAVSLLKSKGLKDVYNGGAWDKLIQLQRSL